MRLLGLSAVLIASACGGSGGGESEPKPPPSVQAPAAGAPAGNMIGPGGAAVAGASGAASPVNGMSGAGGATAQAGAPAGSAGMGAAGMSGAAANPDMNAGAGGSATAGTQATAGGTGGAAGDPLRITITAKAIPPGGEDHVCVVVPLQNEQKAFITSMHATLTTGSHHLIIDKRPAGTPTNAEAARCAPTQGADATRLMIAQQRDTTLEMPQGTGLPIEAHQLVFLQLHYINLQDKAADIEGVFEATVAPSDAPAPQEVKSLFTGALNLMLPSMQESEAEFFFMPQGSTGKPVHVFALTSHTHSLGIESTIERVSNANAPAVTPLHQSLDWHEPPLTTFDPVLEFTGTDGLRLTCKFFNDTDHVVRFGSRFEDEMCFLWLYWY